MMRFTEFFLVIPVFVVILAVVRLFGIIVVGSPLEQIPYLNLFTIIVLLGIFGWPPIARLTRAEFLRLKHMEFVEAARCIGATTSRHPGAPHPAERAALARRDRSRSASAERSWPRRW